MTMSLVETINASGLVYSMTFSNVPQDADDLLLVISHRNPDSAIAYLLLQLNGDTGFNYNYRELLGTGSTRSSINSPGQDSIGIGYRAGGASATTNTFGSTSVYIPNYKSSVAKSLSSDSVFENNATTAYQNITAANWTGTAAITSVSITSALTQFSSASLYKITKA